MNAWLQVPGFREAVEQVLAEAGTPANDGWLGSTEAAAYLGVSRDRIFNLVSQGKLPRHGAKGLLDDILRLVGADETRHDRHRTAARRSDERRESSRVAAESRLHQLLLASHTHLVAVAHEKGYSRGESSGPVRGCAATVTAEARLSQRELAKRGVSYVK